jgi:hypothetical protein
MMRTPTAAVQRHPERTREGSGAYTGGGQMLGITSGRGAARKNSAKIFQFQFIFREALVDMKDRLWVFDLMVEQPV